MLRLRPAPVGEGGLLVVAGVVARSEWEGSESRCLGDRALQSSNPLDAAAVAELQVALALRGYTHTHTNIHIYDLYRPVTGYR